MAEICADCKRHVATENWAEGGVMDYIHGMYLRLCRCCVLKRQEEHLAKCQDNIDAARQRAKDKPCEIAVEGADG